MRYKGFITRLHYQVTGNKSEDLENIAQLLSNELEDKIRKNPDRYFWFNKRWKTRPPKENDKDIY